MISIAVSLARSRSPVVQNDLVTGFLKPTRYAPACTHMCSTLMYVRIPTNHNPAPSPRSEYYLIIVSPSNYDKLEFSVDRGIIRLLAY